MLHVSTTVLIIIIRATTYINLVEATLRSAFLKHKNTANNQWITSYKIVFIKLHDNTVKHSATTPSSILLKFAHDVTQFPAWKFKYQYFYGMPMFLCHYMSFISYII
jgi:hypothetical protein